MCVTFGTGERHDTGSSSIRFMSFESFSATLYKTEQVFFYTMSQDFTTLESYQGVISCSSVAGYGRINRIYQICLRSAWQHIVLEPLKLSNI